MERQIKKSPLLKNFEKAVTRLENSGLKKKALEAIRPDLEAIAGVFDITTDQAMLFAIIVNLSFNTREVNLEQITGFLNCNHMMILQFYQDFEVLMRANLIKKCFRSELFSTEVSHVSYYVSAGVVEQLLEGNTRPEKRKQKELTDIDLVEMVYRQIEEREHNQYEFHNLYTDVLMILEQYKDQQIVRKMELLGLDIEDKLVLFYVLRNSLNGNEEVDITCMCSALFSDPNDRFQMKRALISGKSRLIKKKLVQLEDGFFRSDRQLQITREGAVALLGEDAGVLVGDLKEDPKLMEPGKRIRKKLHYNHQEEKRIAELVLALNDERYRTLQENLKARGFPPAITILFYGPPGTGKTESVYQLARQTGRKIYRVEISEMKSMWYGRSEKNVKQLFEDYRKSLEKEKLHPILLMNEADGILGSRRKLGGSAVDQTENAIQNILLQELEDFEGILVATTNLTINLDPAFDRRFLYKVRIDLPDEATRFRIWQEKLPERRPGELRDLASRYLFSGGQIDNITRKYFSMSMLKDRKPGFKEILEYCDMEVLNQVSIRKIGFAVNQ